MMMDFQESLYNVTPKKKQPQKEDDGVREIKTKTGATRVVDTRTSNVDLSKYDEKLEAKYQKKRAKQEKRLEIFNSLW